MCSWLVICIRQKRSSFSLINKLFVSKFCEFIITNNKNFYLLTLIIKIIVAQQHTNDFYSNPNTC